MRAKGLDPNYRPKVEPHVVSNNDSISYDFNELVYSASSPAIEGPTGIRAELDFMGYYGNDAGNSSAIVTLTNDVESYA